MKISVSLVTSLVSNLKSYVNVTCSVLPSQIIGQASNNFLFWIVVDLQCFRWDSFSDSFPLRLYKVLNIIPCAIQLGFSGGSAVKNLPANAGDTWDGSLILGLGRSPGEGNGNPLQYSCQDNPMDRGAWRAIVHRVAKGLTWQSHWTCTLVVQFYKFTKKSFNCTIVIGESYAIWKWKSLSCVWLCDSPWNSPGQNTGVGSLFVLPGIFLIQGLNLGLPHCRWILYQLSHQGSPRILEWVAYPFSSESPWPRNQMQGSPALQEDSFPTELPGKPDMLSTP